MNKFQVNFEIDPNENRIIFLVINKKQNPQHWPDVCRFFIDLVTWLAPAPITIVDNVNRSILFKLPYKINLKQKTRERIRMNLAHMHKKCATNICKKKKTNKQNNVREIYSSVTLTTDNSTTGLILLPLYQ